MSNEDDKNDLTAQTALERHGFVNDGNTVKKRIYRRPKDLPDPSKDHRSERNRTTERVVTRISPEHAELFNELAKQYPTKRAAFEAAIEILAKTAPK